MYKGKDTWPEIACRGKGWKAFEQEESWLSNLLPVPLPSEVGEAENA